MTELRRAGLTFAEAARRLAEFGPNAVPEAPSLSLFQRLLGQFKSALIYILLMALVLDLALWFRDGAKDVPHEAIAIGLILALNAGLGVYQEHKAEQALTRLKALAAPIVWVVRAGELVQVQASELVPGDIARIEAGDRIPADSLLVEGSGLSVDESILTGKLLPIEKTLDDNLLSGTLVGRGKGYIEVQRTGMASALGRLATIIGSIETGKTPLEKRLGIFGNQVAAAILAAGVMLTIGGLIVEGPGRLGQVALFSVALAVAAVPEGLPAVLTLTLALGVERLARRKAIVRRLSAVEALGSVTVIATDKTGTLTENRMFVREIDATDTEQALLAMLLANDAEIATGIGDPLEVALLDFVVSQGRNPAVVVAERPRLASRPFDSTARFMQVTVAEGDRRVSYLKGAPEVLIARSRLTPDAKAQWEAKAQRRAGEGYRVLGLASRLEDGSDAIDLSRPCDALGSAAARSAGRSAPRARRRHPGRHGHGRPSCHGKGRWRGRRHPDEPCRRRQGHRSGRLGRAS